MERALANDYELTMTRAFDALNPSNAEMVVQLAQLPARMRGYGHVKLGNVAAVKRTERALAAQLSIEPATSPDVQQALDQVKGVGTLRGIPVVAAK
jgi:indolepyruvate ferredoxin oxidoreductase